MYTTISHQKSCFNPYYFCVFYVLFLDIGNTLKYIAALIISIFCFFILLKRNCKINYRTLQLLLFPQIILTVYSLLLSFNSYPGYLIENLKYIFFITFPVFISWCFVMAAKVNKVNIIQNVYYGVVWAYLTKVFLYLVQFGLSNLGIYIEKLTVFYDVNQNQLESNVVPYAAGVLLIYFVICEKKLRAKDLILLLIIFLNGKRIVEISLILTFLFCLIVGRKYKNRIRYLIYAIVTVFYIVMALTYVHWIYNGELRSFLNSHHIFDSGRIYLYSLFSNEWNPSMQFVGRGMGFCEYYLKSLNMIIGNVHSDILRLTIEIGVLGFVLYTVINSICNIKIGRGSVLPVALLIYFEMNYFTDNISIYISVLTVYYTCIMWHAELGKECEPIVPSVQIEEKHQRFSYFRKSI